MLSGIGPSPSYAALGFWGWKFKTEILVGIVGVSAAAGVSAVASNDANIRASISAVLSPVKQAFDQYLVPQLTKIKGGATAISTVFNGWSKDIFSNKISQWIKSQKVSNISKGFFVLTSTLSSWSDSVKEALEKIWGSKEQIAKFLSKEYIAKILTSISEFSSAIKATLSSISSLVFMAAQHFLSPSSENNQDGKNDANSLKKILSSGKLGQFLQSVWSVASENPTAIKTIDSQQVKRLFVYAASNMDLFVSRVANLKESASKTPDSSTGWGKYPTSVELMNAITDNNWGNLAVGFLNFLVSPFSQCKSGQTCSSEHVFHDTVTAFVEAIKGKK